MPAIPDAATPGTRRRGATVRRVRPPPAPIGRPPAWLRLLVAVLAVAAALLTAALMLSDRAPGVLADVFGDDTRRLWARIDASGRADFVADGERPETDAVVHVVVWAAVTGLSVLAVWSWRWLAAVAAGAFGASVVVELAQGRWSSTRAVERSDIGANLVGVTVGTVAAVGVMAMWAAGAALFGRRRV